MNDTAAPQRAALDDDVSLAAMWVSAQLSATAGHLDLSVFKPTAVDDWYHQGNADVDVKPTLVPALDRLRPEERQAVRLPAEMRRVVQGQNRRVAITFPSDAVDLGFQVYLHRFSRKMDRAPATTRIIRAWSISSSATMHGRPAAMPTGARRSRSGC